MSGKDPYLDATMRGYLRNVARKELWKAPSWYSIDDLEQDGYICYYKCHARYTGLTIKRHPSKDDKRRFMKLVKVAFANHIIWLASTNHGEKPVSDVLTPDQDPNILWNLLPAELPAGDLSVLLNNAPTELKALLTLLAGDITELTHERKKLKHNRLYAAGPYGYKALLPPRETSNELYCRLLGLPKNLDILGSLRQYLTGNYNPRI